MSDEETATEEASAEETVPGEPGDGQAPDNSERDGNVNAEWQVVVIPNENVSIHYMVAPADEKDAVTSVTASFVLKKDHMVVHTYAGSTTTELISPKAGQGATGDSGVDSAVFPAEPDGDLYAVLAGTIRKGEETVGYFFERPFDP
ncbi:MAG: hypothetical protein GY719_13900 [bacterium]|nr:hypothetical protein [bacterium]